MFGRAKKVDAAIDAFWRWLTIHERVFVESGGQDRRLFADFVEKLLAIDRRLVFEMKVKERPVELAISADGDRKIFPLVRQVVAAAPRLNEFRVVAFRQARDGIDAIEYGKARISPEELFFLHKRDGLQMVVQPLVRDIGRFPRSDIECAVPLMIDAIVGEHAAVSKVLLCRPVDLTEASGPRRPIEDLPAVLGEVQGIPL